MKNNIVNYIMISSVVLLGACTDLKVIETDSKITTTETGVFLGVSMPSSLDAAYNNLWESNQQNLYALTEATTDEIFIPTRGTDWGDNGVWRDLAKHSWTSAHAYNNATWNLLNSNIYLTNQIIDSKTTKTNVQGAEARFIRAYNMFWVLDLWHQVPYRTAEEGPDVNPRVLTPQQAFDSITTDLTKALLFLPTTTSGSISAQAKASKASANYLLAKMYLNKHIYLGGTAQAADMDKVIGYITAIEADGYTLQAGYFSIFGPSADSETILWSNTQYAQRIWGGLHYNQGHDTDWQFGGWNGFATTAEFYNKFEGPANNNSVGQGQEERRGYVPNNGLGIGFLLGTQYDQNGVILARSGQPLSYTKDIPSLIGNPDYTGIRLLKWHPTINMGGTWNQHLVLMRYADALLMKAEAYHRKSADATALTLVNLLRAKRSATALASITDDNLLDERGRELYLEGWRRNDMIRFGKFNTKFAFVENTDAATNVFPIPDNALGSNPNLKQN